MQLHEENYRVDGLETGSRQYLSWPADIERETVSAVKFSISLRVYSAGGSLVIVLAGRGFSSHNQGTERRQL